MNEYQYAFLDEFSEVFPEEIFNNPYIVFHGTSNYYSDEIEENGFEQGYSPFDENAVESLATLLETENFANYDENNIAGTLRHYLQNNMRLSFTCLSGCAIEFGLGISKGGQIIGKIRRARAVVQTAVTENPGLVNNISPLIENLFQICDDIGNHLGVIYAIRLPENLNGIIDENFVIYSDYYIPATSIIAKVILPDEIEEFNRELFASRNKKKLIAGIGKLIFNKENED